VETLSNFMQQKIWVWTWSQIGLSFLILLAAFVVRTIIIARLSKFAQSLASRTETEADDIAVRAVLGPLGWLVMWVGFYFTFRALSDAVPELLTPAQRIFRLGITFCTAWILFRLVEAAALILTELAGRTESEFDDHLVPLLRKTAKVLVGMMTFVLVVQSLGYSISGLLAGLGLGGFAFALAAKDTIANLFGSVTILIDRPFKVGDWISTNDSDGVVEEIGLRSTRIRTFAKTLVSVPNSIIANETIENHSLMPKRRVKMSIGVTYDTTAKQMQTLVDRVEAFLAEHPGVHQEFKLVKFKAFADSSLELFIYYFSSTTDWTAHLQIRQEVNLGLMEIVEDLGLSMAFPTRTIHMIGEGNSAQE
jgi:MscS family membrane protein